MDRTGAGAGSNIRQQGGVFPLSEDAMRQTADAWLENGGNTAQTARELGITRNGVRHRLRAAYEAGVLKSDPARPANRSRAFSDIRSARIDEFQRVDDSGTYTTPRPVHLSDDRPFVLVALGDPHLDSPGTDLHLWEQWIEPLQAGSPEWVRGVCLGDLSDNWLKFLGFLYGFSESTGADAWTLIEGYLDQIGDSLDCIIGGNHDEWKDELALKMMSDQYGVGLYRLHGATLAYTTPAGREITVGMRHRFEGHSQWNTVHAISKAATLNGWRANILIGGDKHVSGEAKVKDPATGKITHCHQLAAFKVCDEYAEKRGFRDQHITPGVALVINPTHEDDDARLVTTFANPEDAMAFCQALRSSS